MQTLNFTVTRAIIEKFPDRRDLDIIQLYVTHPNASVLYRDWMQAAMRFAVRPDEGLRAIRELGWSGDIEVFDSASHDNLIKTIPAGVDP